MKARVAMLGALAAAVALASVAAAGPDATRQRVAITFKFHERTFVLAPLTRGAVARDSGSMLDDDPGAPCHEVMRDGQTVSVRTGGAYTLTGKRGTLTIRTTANWVNPGSGGCGVAFGTWKVVRGTGVYAGIAGGGRSAYDAHCAKWYARHEGYVTSG